MEVLAVWQVKDTIVLILVIVEIVLSEEASEDNTLPNNVLILVIVEIVLSDSDTSAMEIGDTAS